MGGLPPDSPPKIEPHLTRGCSPRAAVAVVFAAMSAAKALVSATDESVISSFPSVIVIPVPAEIDFSWAGVV